MFPEPDAPQDQPTPLVGREREQAQLLDRLVTALAGPGRLILIGGEAGIGKTTLAEDLCHQAWRRGAVVLTGRCYDLADTPPYGLWLDLLDNAPLLRDASLQFRALPQESAASGGQVALFQQVRDLLLEHAARQPLVILLEDLHWADAASLDLLRFLVRALPGARLLVLVTYRSDEIAADPAPARQLAMLAREAHTLRLDLRRLSPEAMRRLVTSRYRLSESDADRLTAYLDARAAGNPLYVGEFLRALEGSATLQLTATGWTVGDLAGVRVPQLLQQIIVDRLFRLGKEARDLLRVAAVIGQEVPYILWAEATGADEAALEDAVERAGDLGVLEERDDGRAGRFRHAVLREAIYGGIPTLSRRRLHLRVAEAVLRQRDPDPDALAYHLRQAGDERAAEWLVRAGERAQRAYAWLTAADRYEAALALADGAGAAPHQRGWLLVRLALMLRYADPRRSIAHLDAAADPRPGAPPPPAFAAAIRYYRGALRCLLGDLAGGLPELAAGVAALDALPGEALAWLLERWQAEIGDDAIARRHGQLASWLAYVGRFPEARARAGDVAAAPPAPARRDELQRADAHVALLRAAAAEGQPAAARAALGQARDLYRAAGNRAMLYVALGEALHGVALPYAPDDLAGRETLARETDQAYAQMTGATADETAGIARHRLLLLEGRWAALQQLPIAQHPASDVGLPLARNTLALLAREQGRPEAAWRRVREALPLGAASDPGEGEFAVGAELLRLAAGLATDATDFPAARAWLAAHDRWLAWSGAARGQAEGALGWAAYHRAAGDPVAAREHAARALALAGAPRQPLALLAAHRALGELDTAAGRRDAARSHLDAALALADDCAAPYERALTLLAAGELHLLTNGRDRALALSEQARAILAPLDAKPALTRAEALASRLKAASLPAHTRPAGLTAREAEVLRLVARGLTDAEVAEQLFLSPRTVTTHLTSVYNKLGVSSRAAATRFAIEQGLA